MVIGEKDFLDQKLIQYRFIRYPKVLNQFSQNAKCPENRGKIFDKMR